MRPLRREHNFQLSIFVTKWDKKGGFRTFLLTKTMSPTDRRQVKVTFSSFSVFIEVLMRRIVPFFFSKCNKNARFCYGNCCAPTKRLCFQGVGFSFLCAALVQNREVREAIFKGRVSDIRVQPACAVGGEARCHEGDPLHFRPESHRARSQNLLISRLRS